MNDILFRSGFHICATVSNAPRLHFDSQPHPLYVGASVSSTVSGGHQSPPGADTEDAAREELPLLWSLSWGSGQQSTIRPLESH